MRILGANYAVVTGGTNALCVTLPVGCRLKSASGHNGDNPFTRVKIYLSSRTVEVPPGPTTPNIGSNQTLPLTQGIQGGMNDQVTWHGDLSITNENCVVILNAWDCEVGNLLNMEVGIDD